MHGIFAMTDDALQAALLRAYVVGALSTAAALEREKRRRRDARSVSVEVRDAA